MASVAVCSMTPVTGLCGASLKVKRTSKSSVQLKSDFWGAPRAHASALKLTHPTASSRVTCFARDWLRKDLSVVGFGLVGWLAPSSIPAINGNSLTGLFFEQITKELSHFPTGPAVDSPFWLWFILWHVGLFIVLLLGQVGFKGRGDGYFS